MTRLHTTSSYLTAVPPFDFSHSLRFLGLFTPTAGEQALSDQRLMKAIQVGGQTVVFAVQAEGEGLALTLHSRAPLAATALAAAQERVSFFLSLQDDLNPFYALAEADDAFRPVVQRWYGYHQVKFLTPFENACWAILSTRNRVENARTIKARLIDACGGRLVVEGQSYPAFPIAEAVAALDPQQLVKLVGQGRRAEFLAAAAEAFAGADELWLRTAPYEHVKQWLLDIKGIGPWGAAFVLIRGLGRMERLEAPERNLLQAASQLYGRPLTVEALAALAHSYASYQAYWAHYVRANAEKAPGRLEGISDR